MPRLAPITGKADVPAEHHAAVDSVVKVFGSVRGPFSMLLHSPKLAVRERESAYPWAAQVNLARRHGIREDVLDVIRTKGDPGALPEDERDVVVSARQLTRGNRADQALFDALKNRHGAQWMVEVTAAVLYFALVAGVANAFEIAPLPDGEKLPG